MEYDDIDPKITDNVVDEFHFIVLCGIRTQWTKHTLASIHSQKCTYENIKLQSYVALILKYSALLKGPKMLL